MDDFAVRLSVGPIDIDLSDRDLSHLEAVISQPRPARELANPNVAQTLAKLKAIRTYNVKRRERRDQQDPHRNPELDAARNVVEWCRDKIRALVPRVGTDHDALEPSRLVRSTAIELVQRLTSAGFVDEASRVNIGGCITTQDCIGLLSRFEQSLSKAVAENPALPAAEHQESSPQEQTPDDPERRQQRSCHARDQLWLKWYNSIGPESGNVFGQIRDRWNALPDAERAEYTPCHARIAKGRPGYDIVRKGIQAATKDGGK